MTFRIRDTTLLKQMNEVETKKPDSEKVLSKKSTKKSELQIKPSLSAPIILSMKKRSGGGSRNSNPDTF